MEKFKDLAYERPNVSELKRNYLKAVSDFRKAKTFEEAMHLIH